MSSNHFPLSPSFDVSRQPMELQQCQGSRKITDETGWPSRPVSSAIQPCPWVCKYVLQSGNYLLRGWQSNIPFPASL